MGKPLVAIVAVLLMGAWFADSTSSTDTVQGRRAMPHDSGGASGATRVVTAIDAVTNGPVLQAAPTWIAIEPGILGRTMLNPAGIRAVSGAVIPADNRPVFRADSNQPGTNSPGTSFIVGHNYADASGDFVPFSALADVAPGHSVVVGTPNGTLGYVVEQVFRVPKDQIASRTDLLVNVPGRLILETCDTTDDGYDTNDNLVVITQLAK